MNFLEFLHFNKYCPLCNEPLTLYMQWVDGPCYRATKVDTNVYRFDQFACIDVGIEKAGLRKAYMDLEIFGDKHNWDYRLSFSTPGFQHEAKRFQIYFFYMCNPQGFKTTRQGKSYDLVPYRGCYHRSSVMLSLANDKLFPIDPEKSFHKEETFCFKKQESELEKVYILTTDEEEKQTKMWYYTITDVQKKDGGPRSKVFEKFLPPLGKRPNVQDKQAMIDRLDSWIIIS